MQVKILNRLYDVEITTQQLSIEDNWGLIHHAKNLIQIRNNLNPQIMIETLIHEMIHAVDHQLELKFKEELINRLTTGVYSIIFDNDWNEIKKLCQENKI